MTNDTAVSSTMTSRLIRRQLTLPDGTVLMLLPDEVVKFERVTEESSRSPIDLGLWERTNTVEFAEGNRGQWVTSMTTREHVG